MLVQVVEGREKLREETSEENQPTVVTHNQGNSPNEFLLTWPVVPTIAGAAPAAEGGARKRAPVT